ncbi:ATP-dependent RNA helicase DOB1 [Fragilaria crotonensis]|nr:ATP-dependent RNA helicase DOB1 [Fragilaria crotonensis]
MAGCLSVERLHQILLEEEEENRRREKIRRVKESETAAVQKHLNKIWQQHGMQAPFEGAWIRPLPSSLYKTPLSAPQTTLATWSSLPKPIQDKLTAKPNELGVVEVPLAAFVPGEQGISLQQRPLAGNLANKLKEYTRGVPGQTKPFRAGGVDVVEEEHVNPYHTPEAIQRALKPIDQGTEASWKDGSLFTAPPGLDFDVGLGWEDVYLTKPAPTRETSMGDIPLPNSSQDRDAGGGQAQGSASAVEYTKQGVWERSYFDDDSLWRKQFG